MSIENQLTTIEEKTTGVKKQQASTPKPHGKNIYLSSRIDGAIEVLKKSKLKEDELKKSKERKFTPDIKPEEEKLRLAAIFEIEKKYQDALKARHL